MPLRDKNMPTSYDLCNLPWLFVSISQILSIYLHKNCDVPFLKNKETMHTINLLSMRRGALAFVMAMAGAAPSLAYDIEVDGIYYNISSETSNEVEVTGGDEEYSGFVTVPESVTYGDVIYTVTGIGDNAFRYCEQLTGVSLPATLTTIGEAAFAYCDNLADIALPSALTEIGDVAFRNCGSITSLSIPSSVTVIGDYVFYNCTALADISLPSSLTMLGDYAFYFCKSLQSVSLPTGITKIGDYVFYCCTSLADISLPSDLTAIGDHAFYSCKALTTLALPSSLTTIGDDAFSRCKSLLSVTMPSSLNDMGRFTFYGCESLSAVTIPSGVEEVGDYAFYGCTALSTVTIGDGVESIGEKAFYGCTALSSVYGNPSTPPTCHDDDVFSTSTYSDATLYVADDARDDYLSTSPWSLFTNIDTPDNDTLDSGISLLKTDADTLYTVYSIGGTLIMRSANRESVNDLPEGIYIINGKKTMIGE